MITFYLINITNTNSLYKKTHTAYMENDIDVFFAAALRYFLDKKNRPQKNLNQKKLGELTGVSQSFISQLVTGKTTAKEATKRSIVAVYQWEYEKFLNLGRSLILTEDSKKPDREPVHKDIKTSWQGEAGQTDPDHEPDKSKPKNKLEPIRQQHVCLIDLFPDQKEAYELNKKLLEIKKNAPEQFDKIKGIVDVFHKDLDLKKIAGDNSE